MNPPARGFAGAVRIALVHDWLNGMRGGEKVFEAIAELALAGGHEVTVHTLFYEAHKVSPFIRGLDVRESPWASRTPQARRRYRWLLPLLPAWAEALPLASPAGAPLYDLVLSTSHCVAKGVRTGGAPHACYCFTPMRYAWDRFDDYFGGARAWRPASLAMRLARRPLQRWDRATAQPDRVTAFATSSFYVRDRIRRHYGREAAVVAPPVEWERFAAAADAKVQPRRGAESYFLLVSALEPYKRVDLAVEAFRRLGEGHRLVVAGSGTQAAALRQGAPSNVEFRGWVADEALPGLYAGAQALVFPAEEDFGIVPLEAAAAGVPTLALGRGGSLETVRDGSGGGAATGVFFREQTVESLLEAVREFEAAEGRGLFQPAALRSWAQGFSKEAFGEGFRGFLKAGVGLDLGHRAAGEV